MTNKLEKVGHFNWVQKRADGKTLYVTALKWKRDLHHVMLDGEYLATNVPWVKVESFTLK